jgi:drug/metabolite transporter (DMT)-like permease
VRPRDVAELLALGAIWGASFLFMRIAAPEFGPLPLMALRVAVAALCLLPLWLRRRELSVLRTHRWPLVLIGIANSAIPFSLFGYAVLSLSAGLAAILNSTAPLFAALIAHYWLGERLTPRRAAGLVLGFGGVVLLLWDRTALPTRDGLLGLAAGLAGAASYGFAVGYTKRRLAGVSPLAIASLSQVVATLALLPLAWLFAPAVAPSGLSWGSAVVLGVLCTAVAYILYFRLIANTGPTRAIAVTFLVPVFGLLWGSVFLGEVPTWRMLAGCVIILFGTALANGLLAWPRIREA